MKLPLASTGCTDETDLPLEYPHPKLNKIMGEHTFFKAKAVWSLMLPMVWEEDAVRDPLSWWKQWWTAVLHLQSVAVKIMKLPFGFAAGERWFSNASHIQSRLRTRLSYTTLHNLMIYI